MIAQGDVWWADLGEPTGSEAAYRRPVVVVQCDAFNRSRIAAIVCVPLTSNLRWAGAPGNVVLEAVATGLPKDAVANVSQIAALDRGVLDERVGRLADRDLALVLRGCELSTVVRGIVGHGFGCERVGWVAAFGSSSEVVA